MGERVSERESANPVDPSERSADEPSLFAGLLEEARHPRPDGDADPTGDLPVASDPDLDSTQAMAPVTREAPRARAVPKEGASRSLLASGDAPLPPPDGRADEDTLRPEPAERAATRILGPLEDGAPEPAAPRRMIGSYELRGVLGEGGMAIVHRAYQPSLERPVAIKSLREEYLHDLELVRRFEREAASLAQLQHGNVVQVLDVLHTEDDGRHIVMELVEGVDGFDLLEAAGRLPPDVVALIALEVARGLEHAHLRGIVHRDIKPSNVFISKRGEVKLMDFGIARDPASSELTQIGLSVGTPAYMAPEQIRGEAVDGRTDVFAVGIVLYELLGGQPPWPEGKGKNVALDVLRSPAPPLAAACPEAPAELVRIVERCLEKFPEARWPSAHALRKALEALVHERVPIDPRGRLVLDLEARGFVTPEEARRLVPPELRAPAPREDRRPRAPAATRVLKPIAIAHAVGLAVIVAAAVLTRTAPVGVPLPAERPRLAPLPAERSRPAPAARGTPPPAAPMRTSTP